MEHREEVVDKVLAGLRAITPPAGMEARIQLALQSHPVPTAAGRSTWSRIQRPAMRAGIACALGCAAWSLFLLAGLESAAKHVLPQVIADGTVRPAVPNSGSVHSRKQFQIAKGTPYRREAGIVRAGHLSAVSSNSADTTASLVSFPAPPAPLTEQERLLLLLVHGQRRAKLPTRNANKQEAKETEQFLEFFKPEPSIVVNEAPPPADGISTNLPSTILPSAHPNDTGSR